MARWVGAFGLVWLLASGLGLAQNAGVRFAVDPAASDVHWLVYKAGALSRLGHNHAIAVGDLRGSVWQDDADLGASRFELEFSTAALVIDDAALRATLGADFASVPTANDIAGTRTNMLGERVLNGLKFPVIRVVGTGPAARNGVATLAITVELLGRSIPLDVPTRISVDGDTITASGEFELNHADLGMQPFSVMMGALQVGEKLSFSYNVTARRDEH